MKTTDVKQLTYVSGPTYNDLSGLKSMFERWEKTYGLNLDPDFQRGHVWTEAQQVKFVEFIVRGGKFPPVMFNSPVFGGHNKPKNCDLPDEITLVDGKQRLTAITKFINNELQIFDGMYLKDFEDAELFLRRADFLYTVNKIATRKELITWYLEINEGQVAHTPEELARVRSLIA